MKKNTEVLRDASKEIGMEINGEKIEYCVWICLEIGKQDEITI
jgi:hypothetical protein